MWEDARVNRGEPKIVAVMIGFRIAAKLRASPNRFMRAGYLFWGTIYKFLSEWILGIELPASTPVGRRLRIHHGFGLVVNPQSVIGDDVTLRQGVTIGNRGESGGCPVLGDGVNVGVNATILGAVRVGRGASVGAHSLVLEDVPDAGRIRAPRAHLVNGSAFES